MPIERILIGGAFLEIAILDVALVLAAAPSPAVSQTTQLQTTHATPNVSSIQNSVQNVGSGAIVAELAKPVSAKKAKPNDKIECKVTMDLVWRGQIVLARGTRIVGRVAEARARTKGVPESMVKIAFDSVVLKDGREIPLRATIQALGAPLQNSVSNLNDLDLVNQTDSHPAPGPNEMRRIQVTSFPGSRRPANAESGGVEGPDTSGVHRDGPALGPLSHGVVGVKGVSLSNNVEGSEISSTRENVHLSGGTQLVLHVTEPQAFVDSLAKTKN
jgi:hypothetical protein